MKTNAKHNPMPSANSKPSSALLSHMSKNLIEALPVGMVAYDLDFNITDMNPQARVLLGEGGNIVELLSHATINGSEVDWPQRLNHVFEQGQPCSSDSVYYTRQGKTHIFKLNCTPIVDEISSEIISAVMLIEDITDVVTMQNNLASAERLAAVGKLAARVAHELNNPLDGIIRYINMALRLAEKNSDEQSIRYMTESRKGLQRMVQIVSELLEFSRNTSSAVEEAEINKIIEESIKAMTPQLMQNKIEIKRDFAEGVPSIRSGNLLQVFCNLIKNASDAMPGGGLLEITSRIDENHVVMTFADTGAGLTDEVLERLFDPFFTTKESGKGTGLGLAICKDIIERYNGEIHAANRSDVTGACFTIRIPLASTSQD